MPRDRARALAEALLDRHGVLTRPAVLAEGIPGGFSSVYGELRLMEEGGLCQRGYFVEGLGGAQFALPAAVERLRDVRSAGSGGATRGAVRGRPGEPARPPSPLAGGAAASWRAPPAPGWCWSAARLALYVERGGRGIVVLDPELLEPAIEALAGLVADGRVRRLAIERVDGEPVGGTARRAAADRARLPAGAAAGRAACLRARASCWPRAGWRRSSATR